MAAAVINPRLTFMKIVVSEKKRVAKTMVKKTGTAPKVSGSTKTIIRRSEIQRKRVIARRGKKFFLFLIWFLRISRLIVYSLYDGSRYSSGISCWWNTAFRSLDQQKIYGVKREPEDFSRITSGYTNATELID